LPPKITSEITPYRYLSERRMHSRRRGTYVEHRYARDAVLIPRPCPRSVTSITFMPVDELERYGPECDLEYGDEKEADQDGSFLLWGNG
jgi:hypothetical protein